MTDEPRRGELVPSGATSPRPRRVTSPSWLDVRLVLGVVLVIGSVLAGARLVGAASHTAPVLVARHDLTAGTILRAGDVSVLRAKLPGDASGAYLTGVDEVTGKQLARTVAAGELLPSAALRAVHGETTMTLPLAAASAPELHKGERIVVWLSTGACPSMVLLRGVAVQSVRADEDLSFGSGTAGQDVVISVAPELAQRVVEALALDDARLRAGVVVGATPTASKSAAALPEVSRCTGHSP
ncbi:MAG TPA: SAF domain-containing protein [Jatrophihabitans sp.]|nr:SAF domain-containing protein [Jatrophihabitans sp.]